MSRQYSLELKKRVLEKLYSPTCLGLSSLSREFGIPVTTIFSWKNQAVKQASPSKNILPRNWSYSSKVEAVLEASKLSSEDLGGWLREKGLYSEYLELWKKEIIDMGQNEPNDTKEALKQALKENAQLKAELRRKDKALAEASALLILKKKAHLIWGNDEED